MVCVCVLCTVLCAFVSVFCYMYVWPVCICCVCTPLLPLLYMYLWNVCVVCALLKCVSLCLMSGAPCELSNNCSWQCRSTTSGRSCRTMSFIVAAWPCILLYNCGTVLSTLLLFCGSALPSLPDTPFPDRLMAYSMHGI